MASNKTTPLEEQQQSQKEQISNAENQPMNYQPLPGNTNTEIEEETKDSRLMNSEANNEELFKHLSYLS